MIRVPYSSNSQRGRISRRVGGVTPTTTMTSHGRTRRGWRSGVAVTYEARKVTSCFTRTGASGWPAGPCWLSHLLNRFGCKTFAVDVSATALKIGRELFESDQRTNWAVRPEFITYDGHRLPLEDDSVDKVVIYDAFHHIPNAAEVLREVARVLRDGGIVGMREPGWRHASTEKALAEVREFGVLENDIVVEDIERLGRRCGLHRRGIGRQCPGVFCNQPLDPRHPDDVLRGEWADHRNCTRRIFRS